MSSKPYQRRTRRLAGTSSTRATPSTWCASSAGWVHQLARVTRHSIPTALSATWKTSLCRCPKGGTIQLAEVADVALGPGFRRGVLEKDGNEVTGGVVLMAHGENPLDVTRRIKAKIRELQAGLPRGVRIVPFYDRTPLIEGAIGTVTSTVVEAMISASLCVLLVLLHLRTSLIIASTLPLAALMSFLIMAVLRRLGIVDIQANAMSLAGIAISIGVLVDSSVVMAENVMHRLREHFGDRAGAR